MNGFKFISSVLVAALYGETNSEKYCSSSHNVSVTNILTPWCHYKDFNVGCLCRPVQNRDIIFWKIWLPNFTEKLGVLQKADKQLL